MTLREYKRQRANALPPVEQPAASLVHRTTDRDQVMTFAQWCETNGISQPTGRRILARGEGPPVLQLSQRRIGIRTSDNLRWQESRVRTGVCCT
jgi:predicted DNA-binding transcriptional regulator AlpA